jgi:hypothetical protein
MIGNLIDFEFAARATCLSDSESFARHAEYGVLSVSGDSVGA